MDNTELEVKEPKTKTRTKPAGNYYAISGDVVKVSYDGESYEIPKFNEKTHELWATLARDESEFRFIPTHRNISKAVKNAIAHQKAQQKAHEAKTGQKRPVEDFRRPSFGQFVEIISKK